MFRVFSIDYVFMLRVVHNKGMLTCRSAMEIKPCVSLYAYL